MRTCTNCKTEKPLDEFYRHKLGKDGFLKKCRPCVLSEMRSRVQMLRQNPDWLEIQRKRSRDNYYRLNYKEKHKPTPEQKKKLNQAYAAKYPEKIAAKIGIKHKKGFHAHHWSYNIKDAKDVFFLRRSDHYTVHRYIVYDQSVFMYRTLSGELLDTRQKHEDHIKWIFQNNGITPYEC